MFLAFPGNREHYILSLLLLTLLLSLWLLGNFPKPPNNSNFPHAGECIQGIGPGNVDFGQGFGII